MEKSGRRGRGVYKKREKKWLCNVRITIFKKNKNEHFQLEKRVLKEDSFMYLKKGTKRVLKEY